MSPIKWLNNLFFLEHLLGVYRNYCSRTTIKKYFILLQIFVQTMLHTIVMIHELGWLLERGVFDQMILIYCCFTVSAYIIYLSSVVTGIYYSRSFVSYYRSICHLSEWFKDDKKLTNSLKKIYWFTLTLIFLLFVAATLRNVEILLQLLHTDPLLMLPFLISQAILRCTRVFQYLMLFFVTMVVVHLSKCLTSLISAVQERVGSCDVSSDEQCDITTEQIQGWVELYRDLANCCEKVTLCFGRQLFFTLTMTISNYILVIYQIIYVKALNRENNSEYRKLVNIIFCYVTLMMMSLVAAQMMSNQGVKIRRVLVRLYNTMIIDSGEVELKLIKDFIRLIKKNPLEIKLLSKISGGMYMLPVILTLTVNSVIIMLQFNHVI